MRSLHEENLALWEMIDTLRNESGRVNREVEMLRRALAQETIRRERVETYLRGWRHVREEWDGREVYGGGDRRRVKWIEGQGLVEIETDEESVDESVAIPEVYVPFRASTLILTYSDSNDVFLQSLRIDSNCTHQ